MTLLSGLLVLALVCAFSLCAGAAAGLDPALLPLPVLAGAAVLLLAAACLGFLPAGLWLVLLLLAAGAVLCARRAGAETLKAAAGSAGLWMFAGAAALVWLVLALRQPMFTQWDEFTAWGLAPKMVKQRGALYVAAPYNLTASHTYPGTSLIAYLFMAFTPAFAEWACFAALDTLCFAGAAAAAAAVKHRWPHGALVFTLAALLPFWFSTVPAGTPSAVYASAMADVPMGFVFGGALCLYFAAPRRRTGLLLALPALALLAMLKDIAFAYGLIAAFVTALDMLFCAPGRPGKKLLGSLAGMVLAALPVLALFLAWGRYTAAADPQTGAGGVGSAGLSYGAVLTGGLKQFFGIGREEKFALLMTLMGKAFFVRRVALVGGGIVTVLLAAVIAAAAAWCAPAGRRRRPVAAYAGLAFCFAALYLFHLILYHYNFAEVEALALKDYERYLMPYYLGWLLVLFCLLGQAEAGAGAPARRAGWVLAAGTAALAAVLCWRGLPVAGFWSDAGSLYTLRQDVHRRAEAANAVLDWDDRVLVLSQGDDATRWYYYKYELTATVVKGYGGIWWGDDDLSHRWDSDFMNLVESLNWELYDYKAVGSVQSLIAYMAEKDCDYLLIDRADAYLEHDFSDAFAGGLTADMPTTLYRFEGPGEGVCFTPAAVAESGVTP